MPRLVLLLPLLVFAPASEGGQPPASPSPPRVGEGPGVGLHAVKLNGHTFTLPAGFTIELAAGSNLVPRPIVAAFDEKGRLYVCDSSGSNEKVEEQLKKKPHRVLRLEDTNGDGTFDKSTVYVPNIMLPEGAMWLNGSLYVGAPPHIRKFTDTDDDGVADKDEVWFDGKTLTGCANDLHGPYAGPDGYIYWCKGAFAKQEYTLPGGKKWSTRAAHIFRARPDGTGLEPVMTGGMDNPVDVVFTSGGERIFSTTFLQHPGGGNRDGLIHAIYGGVYGKDHGPAYEHPWTAPTLMPVMTHLGPAAPAGLHRYESDQFGPEYADNLFACQFNLRTVSRHVLVPSGSTFTTKDSPFVVSDNLDFHPTDVIEDADGSLLIVDTGGWYKLCCPTSQLVKPDVTGAIYRVKKVGSHKVEDPRGANVDWNANGAEHIASHLDDGRPAVRRQAVEWLARGGREATDLLAAYPQLVAEVRPVGALNALRALTRIDDPAARAATRMAYLNYPVEAVRTAAAHAAGLWRDKEAVPQLARTVRDGTRAERRAAAEALGRIGDPAAVGPLADALADEANDRPLDHSLTYALIEIGDPKATADGLSHKSPRVRRAVLAALDAMPGGHLDAKTVLAELAATDAALRDTAWWIAGKHSDWGTHLAGYFADQLKLVEKLTLVQRDELTARLVKFAKTEAVQNVTADALKGAPMACRSVVLRTMARSGLKTLPDGWKAAVLASATGLDDRDLVREAVAVLRAFPVAEKEYDAFVAALPRVALWPAGVVADELNLALLAARPVGSALPPDAARVLFGKFGPDEAPAVRSLAADALTRAKLSPDQLVALVAVLKAVGPLDRPKLFAAFEKSADEAVGRAFVAALTDPAVRPSVRAEQVKPILDKYPAAVKAEADKLYALLAEGRKDETAKLDKLLKELPPGDIRRGQVVFNGTKAQCSACHQIGYVGGKVGPDLTRVGGTRSDRDLLEAIVYPSASFVRSYEPVRVATLDGRTLTGNIARESPDEVVLTIAADKEERIPRTDIESVTPGTISVMPAGLDQQLTVQDLADLVAFLRACK